VLEWDVEIVRDTSSSYTHLKDLFSEENVGIFSSIEKYNSDIEVVKAIKEKNIDVRSFDFDGKKYKRKDCDMIITALEADVKAADEKLKLLDKQAFSFFYHHAGNREMMMKEFLSFRQIHERTESYIDLLKSVNVILQPFHNGTLSLDEIIAAVNVLKHKEEPAFKKYLRSFIDDGIVSENAPDDLLKKSEEFLNSNYVYFKDNAFIDEELNAFNELIFLVLEQLQEARFRYYKSMLVEQLSQYRHPEAV
jgi:hypothetical protein